MTLHIEQETDLSFDFSCQKLADEVVAAAIRHEGFPYECEVNLTLTDNSGIHELNRQFRQIDSPTDVLSFPMLSFERAGDFSNLEDSYEDNFNPDTGEVILGDIVISVEKVKEQAKAFGHSEKREYAFLLLHSMLHLFGYDHMTEEEAAVMEGKQKEILDGLQILR